MTAIVPVPAAGYAYLPAAPRPFSAGVVALQGHALTRVRFRQPHPMAEGLALAAAYIAAQGRPLASLAACELRSPAPLSWADFAAFNVQYVEALRANGFPADTPIPLARSNMAPLFDPPATSTLFAFAYAHPAGPGGSDFIIAGRPENTDRPPHVIAPGVTSAAGMAAKAAYVVDQLRAAVAALGAEWSQITGAQAYTVHSLDGVMDVLRTSGLAAVGLSLFPAYPPVIGLDFEIDVRSVSTECAI